MPDSRGARLTVLPAHAARSDGSYQTHLMIESSVIQSNQYTVHSQEEPRQDEESTGHDTLHTVAIETRDNGCGLDTHYLDAEDGYSVICQLIFKQNDLVVKGNPLLVFQSLVIYSLLGFLHLKVGSHDSHVTASSHSIP